MSTNEAAQAAWLAYRDEFTRRHYLTPATTPTPAADESGAGA